MENATHTYGDSIVPLGNSALVKIPPLAEGGPELQVVVNTNRTQTFNPDCFANLGCDPMAQRILVVKSTNHFYPAFAAIAREVLYVDTGLTMGSPYPSNPAKTPYTKITRKMWPMNDDPHGIGSPHVPWVQQQQQAMVAEPALAEVAEVSDRSRL